MHFAGKWNDSVRDYSAGALGGDFLGHAAQGIGQRDELFDLVLGIDLGNGFVDAGEQALRVALLNGDAVGFRRAKLAGRLGDDEIVVLGDILVGDAAVDDHGVDLIIHELVDEVGSRAGGRQGSRRAYHW